VMKEIDFLPEWYKNSRRRQFSYRTQYVALAGVFLVMMVWNFTSLNSISRATAELAQMATRQSKAQNASKEFTNIKNKVKELQTKAQVIREIDPKIDVAGVLAEMSFLLDEKIVLRKVEFVAEKFLDSQWSQPSTGYVVRVAPARFGEQQALPIGDVRFKVVINGVAADASDVAALVRKLEDSPYFCLVYPSFSRNTAILTDCQVSEFEISCYLANYRQDGF